VAYDVFVESSVVAVISVGAYDVVVSTQSTHHVIDSDRLATGQCRLYLHWGPRHPPAEGGPSLESIYRVSLTVDLCEG